MSSVNKFTQAKKGGKAKKKVDPDPNGAKLAAVADPMAEAASGTL